MPFKSAEDKRTYQLGLYKRGKEFVRQLKDRPCADCKKKYPYYVMEFDHVPERGKKKAKPMSLAVGGPASKGLLDELEKCDIVCANCHCVRTHERMNGM